MEFSFRSDLTNLISETLSPPPLSWRAGVRASEYNSQQIGMYVYTWIYTNIIYIYYNIYNFNCPNIFVLTMY